jgi:protein O-mannosyl-transferase
LADNPWVQRGWTLAGLRWAVTTNHNANWHPLTWLSLMTDAQIYGVRAGGFHVTNLLRHVGAVLGLLAALVRMTGRFRPSYVVAALFALHPLHVQSVAWIGERKGLLSTLF